MGATVLNPSASSSSSPQLLSNNLHPFSDVDVIAGQKHYPAHRAVLAVHSLDFRQAFAPTSTASTTTTSTATSGAAASSAPTPQPPTPRYRVHIKLDNLTDAVIRQGWQLIYSYIYGVTTTLDTDSVLSALPICRRYRFEQLSNVLEAYLCDGAVTVENCTRVFSITALNSSNDALFLQTTAWDLMKTHFESVHNWHHLPYTSFVRLLKLNDLNLTSEYAVFTALQSWISNTNQVDDHVVASLVKLVRFPTMTTVQLQSASSSTLLQTYPVCKKYVSRGLAARADEKRGLVRSILLESSPVYRPRRVDALTFSDRVAGWSRVVKSVHTSSRYFAGCLWNLILEPSDEWIGLHLGCLSENEERCVDVELDFALFVVRHSSVEPELVSKQVKGAGFGRSGQRVGFAKMIRRRDVEDQNGRFLLRDTLFIGASIRLRSSKDFVIGISDADDTAESESSVI